MSTSVKDPAAQAQLVTMLDRLDVLETTQSDLRIQYPALGAINVQQAAKMSGKVGENEILLQQISGEFNKTRTSADQLIGQIQKDPAAALQLDRIVADTLAQDGVDKKKRQAGEPKSKAVLNWLEGEQGKDTAIKAVGTLTTGGLTLAAFFAPEFAAPLLEGAALTGMATGLYELPQLMRQNSAAESAQFGGKKLTSLEREETRFNMAMGYTNIVMAGSDTQLGQAAIKGLTKIPGVVVAAAKLTAQQSRVFVASLAGINGEVTDAVVQRIAAGVRKADAATTMIVDNGDGTLTAVRPLGKAADKVDDVAAKSASRRSAPKAFDAYENAPTVKPFIGTKVDPNNLPEGYLYGKIPIGKDEAGQDIFREVVYMPKPKNTTVPLVVEKGTIQMGKEGEYRIVEKAVYDKNVVTDPTKPGKLLGGDSQIHHLFADNMLRNTPFGQRALRLGAVNPDGSMNLIELASSKSNLADALKAHPNVKFSDFIHNTQHPKFDGLMQEVVDGVIKEVREAKGLGNLKNEKFIPQMTKEEIKAVWEESLSRMRRGLMGEDRALYKEIEKRTRPGKKSLAQDETPDNSEVA
jgi:hypothetical protein